MDLYRIIRELVLERERVQKIIESLETFTPEGKPPFGRSQSAAGANSWMDRRAGKYRNG
jgi:hypothetical protein